MYETCEVPEHADYPEACRCYRNAPGFFAETDEVAVAWLLAVRKYGIEKANAIFPATEEQN